MQSSQETASQKILERMEAIERLITKAKPSGEELQDVKAMIIENSESAYESAMSDEIKIAFNLLSGLEEFDEVVMVII